MNEFPANHTTALVLFRDTLCTQDHQALSRAARDGHRVCPVVLPVRHPDRDKTQRLAEIESLKVQIENLEGLLFISDGDVRNYLQRVMRLTGANIVYWNKAVITDREVQDDQLRLYLGSASIETHIVSGNPATETPPAAMSMAGNWLLDDAPSPPQLLFWLPGPTAPDNLVTSLTSLDNAKTALES